MKKYIDRQLFLDTIKKNAPFLVSLISPIILITPTADVVPVVRCRECKHFKTNINKDNYCNIHSTRWDKFYVNENEYCSRGEKR
jgi:hypothetical protein